MNGRSYGYLVRSLNELASLRARCRLKDVQRPVPAKVPVRTEGYGGAAAMSKWRADTRVDGVDDT